MLARGVCSAMPTFAHRLQQRRAGAAGGCVDVHATLTICPHPSSPPARRSTNKGSRSSWQRCRGDTRAHCTVNTSLYTTVVRLLPASTLIEPSCTKTFHEYIYNPCRERVSLLQLVLASWIVSPSALPCFLVLCSILLRLQITVISTDYCG
jgi:hypothetical protein